MSRAKRFNTAGPCRQGYDYMIPPLRQLPQAHGLVGLEVYFVLHAPRQTGKTTTIRALAEELTGSGRYAALAFTCETGRAAGDDYPAAQEAILSEIRTRAEDTLPPELRPPRWPRVRPGYTLVRLGLDRGTLVIFDRRSGDTALGEITRFEEATTPSGRQVTLLRA